MEIKKNILIIDGLINVAELDDSLIFDLRYATYNNFLKRILYPVSICVLQLDTAKKLSKANSRAKELGFRLKVLDAYRPLSIQKQMWDFIRDENYIAPPWRGSCHNRGAAVDVTLADESGNEVEMPSDFDDFSKRAWIGYMDASEKAIENRELLGKIMTEAGFLRIESEWWHFNDSEYNKYKLYDIELSSFCR